MAAAVAGVVILGGVVAVALLPNPASAPGAPQDGAASTLQIGGPFRLVGAGGRVVTDADFRGRYMLIYFGYTHCPDACPTTLGDVSAAIDSLPAAKRGRVVPIDTSTPQELTRQLQKFGV
jgi:protein SCO1/2